MVTMGKKVSRPGKMQVEALKAFPRNHGNREAVHGSLRFCLKALHILELFAVVAEGLKKGFIIGVIFRPERGKGFRFPVEHGVAGCSLS